MTGTTTSERRSTADHATTAVAVRRVLSRLFVRADLLDRSSRRAGIDPFPAVLVTPRVWVALG